MRTSHLESTIKSTLFWALFLITFLAVPYAQLDHLSKLPGDIGDARLNNYFLENIYQYLQGYAPSLIHLNFFHPFPYVLGYSENLFGSAPAYLIPRIFSAESDTAFQIWYLFGYVANYVAAYYALRKLDLSVMASIAGALIFAFALPVTAHSGHAQLHYRFGVPLAVAMFILFLERKDWRLLATAVAWLVWQFYCSIYIGFFLLLLLAVIFCTYVAQSAAAGSGGFKTISVGLFNQFFRLPLNQRVKLGVVFIALLLLLVVLFYPYLQVSMLYDAKRHWPEIASMLPRPQSYFLADNSMLWASQAEIFASLPMRHEHQMFIGAVPLLLAAGGFIAGQRSNNHFAFPLISRSLAIIVLITLCLAGFSIWYLFAKLPLASAIRAMTRIVLVLLFPMAYLSAVAVDRLMMQSGFRGRVSVFILIVLMIVEFSAIFPGATAKAEWRKRVENTEAMLPENLAQDAILFFAQGDDPHYAKELDAMWVALNNNRSTMNGYSGLYPPGFAVVFGDDCTEVPKRILSYLDFAGQSGNKEAYLNLMKRIVPIGFSGCDQRWWSSIPPHTRAERIYTKEEIKHLSYEYLGQQKSAGLDYVMIRIVNKASQDFAASSSLKKPIRLSYRFIDADGNPSSGWDTRKDLPFDIPANGSLDVRMLIDPKSARGDEILQISMVQEYVFWAHDIGIAPLEVRWNAQ